ncbi:MAG: Stealth CR1 domain-containing protein [Armatimonadetes bacterium]|nr:Stealth CR1 domain-containing protein [Armatimonadota bacterium]
MLEPIDAVYTWVDGADPDYARVREEWASRLGVKTNPERDRDGLELLRYSLRSLEANAPWIRRIFLVTMRPQAPAWLDGSRAAGRMQLVHHDEIFPRPEDLPTFNSNAIDFHLANIPGLSSMFLYFNDDYFLGRPLEPQHLLRRGKIRVYLPRDPIPEPQTEGPLDSWASVLHSTNRLLDRLYGRRRRSKHEHTPCLIRKELLCMDAEEIRRTQASRFRADTDVALETYYSHVLLEEHSGVSQRVPDWEFLLSTSFHRLENNSAELRRVVRQLRLRRPRFFCLNDDMGPDPDPRFLRGVREFLESYYPRKLPYER